jgi:hypothetical protein
MCARSSKVGKWNIIRVFVVRGVIDEEGSKTEPDVGGRRRWYPSHVLKGVHERGGGRSWLRTRVTAVGDSVMVTQRGLVGSTSTGVGFVSVI